MGTESKGQTSILARALTGFLLRDLLEVNSTVDDINPAFP